MLHTIPGDYATALLLGGEEVYENASQEQIEEVREKLGLSGSMPEQYIRWLGDFFRGDFGTSWHTRQSVAERMGLRIVTSFQLGLMAVTIACGLGVVGGVISAVRQDKWIDYALRASSMTLQAMPSFWLALIVIVLLVVIFEWIPSIQYEHFWNDPLRNLEVLLLPAFIVGLRSSAEILRMTRSSVLEVLKEDFVRTADAKGLRRNRVLFVHVLRNALLPVATLGRIRSGLPDERTDHCRDNLQLARPGQAVRAGGGRAGLPRAAGHRHVHRGRGPAGQLDGGHHVRLA